eukprot:3289321-Rhodomonas_salina.1
MSPTSRSAHGWMMAAQPSTLVVATSFEGDPASLTMANSLLKHSDWTKLPVTGSDAYLPMRATACPGLTKSRAVRGWGRYLAERREPERVYVDPL